MYSTDTLSIAYIQGAKESPADETTPRINIADYLPISRERLNAIKGATVVLILFRNSKEWS